MDNNKAIAFGVLALYNLLQEGVVSANDVKKSLLSMEGELHSLIGHQKIENVEDMVDMFIFDNWNDIKNKKLIEVIRVKRDKLYE